MHSIFLSLISLFVMYSASLSAQHIKILHSGKDISLRGFNWKSISKESFHVCRKAKNGKTVFLAGANSRIAKLTW